MLGIRFDLDPVNFVCFRNPITNSTILTYPIPPFTTIIGLLESCLGKPSIEKRNDLKEFHLIDKVRIGLRILDEGSKNREIALILKLKEGSGSSPVFREFLAYPKYRVYLTSDNKSLLERIHGALKNPRRPLYLGSSDDLVDIRNIKMLPIQKVKSNYIDGIGFYPYPDTSTIQIPWKFMQIGKSWNVEKVPVSIPTREKIFFDIPKEVYVFEEDRIELSPPR